ncbi:MAG: phosphatidylserine decarboxylase [Burkholderiales bacterium]|nr:phosphatidylserine decarboxylase [Burkholderiales bacterium]
MAASGSVLFLIGAAAAAGALYLFWRYVWFFRNPRRVVPPGDGLLSPADGRVVYVREVGPGEPVVSVKKGLAATLHDLVREHVEAPRLVIGVFMSPFDVHYNRAPLSGAVGYVRHYPGRGPNLHMGAMHWRLLLRRPPYHRGSEHIVANERTVTRIDGELGGTPLSCYVVQIAARTVAGIDSYVPPGGRVERGAIFGMIRIGSQVDLVIPLRPDLRARVRPGERVRAGETVLVERIAARPA